MKVIVSDKVEDKFTEFKVVDNTQWIKENQDDIDTVIFHSTKESDFAVGVNLSAMCKKGTVKFIYINANPQTTIKMVISGAGGFVITDEFYLDDEEELMELLKACGMDDADSETSLANVSVQVVKDFVQSFVRGEERIKTPAYLEMVNSAINQLSTITAQQELQITTMGNSAIDIFRKASDLIKNMQANHTKIEQQLKMLESNQDAASSNTGNSLSFNSNVVMYPPVRYNGSKPLLLIREYSPCRYLTSFVLGYTHHVHFAKNTRVKLIVAHQKGAGVAAKYDIFTSINEQSAGYTSLYTNEFISTNTPTKDILRELFKQPVDVFIVVDRLYGTQDIVNGVKINKINAVSGISDIDRYNLKPEDTIVSIAKQEGVFATLMTLKNYESDTNMRQALYEQAYAKVYAKIDEFLGLGA